MKLAFGLVVAMLATGCSKNSDFEALIKANDALVTELKEKADKEGPEAVKKAFDAKKEDLKTRYGDLKTARGFQVSSENQAKLKESLGKGVIGICGLKLKEITDREKSAVYDGICKEYTAVFSK